jgi:hypothetical protein
MAPSSRRNGASGNPGAIHYLFACTFEDAPLLGVHVLDVTNPGAPVHVGFWPQPVADPLCVGNCAPHDAFVQSIFVPALGQFRDVLVVADWGDGVWLVDVTDPTAPTSIAHFGYTWTTPDVDGDSTPDGCDVWGTDTAALAGGSYPSFTHDARITPDEQYLWTADEKNAGGHVLIWISSRS